MTNDPDKPRTHANAGSGARVANTADSVVATDDAARSAADGGSADDVIRVDPGTRADCVARPTGDGSNDADRAQPTGGRPGTTGPTTNHAHRTNSFQ
jgi:hypothetical protein